MFPKSVGVTTGLSLRVGPCQVRYVEFGLPPQPVGSSVGLRRLCSVRFVLAIQRSQTQRDRLGVDKHPQAFKDERGLQPDVRIGRGTLIGN